MTTGIGHGALYDKAMMFAIRIVNLYKYLKEEKDEYIMSKQVLRSGTSIGANISEGFGAESRVDFSHKLSIALKEANETRYWLNLLQATCFISEQQYDSLESDLKEIISLLTASIKTCKTKKNINIENEK